jgi:hypothetical protein
MVTSASAAIEPRADAGFDLVVGISEGDGVTREIRIALHVLVAPDLVSSVLGAQGTLAPFGGIHLAPDLASVYFVPVKGAVAPTTAP